MKRERHGKKQKMQKREQGSTVSVHAERQTDRVRQTESDRQIDRERDWESWGRWGGGGVRVFVCWLLA